MREIVKGVYMGDRGEETKQEGKRNGREDNRDQKRVNRKREVNIYKNGKDYGEKDKEGERKMVYNRSVCEKEGVTKDTRGIGKVDKGK